MRFRDDQGLTIVELTIASFVLLVISALMLTALIMVGRTSKIVAEDTETLTTARIARQRMEREVRQADEILPASTATALALWLDENNDDLQTPDELIVWRLIDIDGVPGGKAELIRSVADTAIADQPNGIHYRSPLGTGYVPFAYSPSLPPGTQQISITLIVEPETDTAGGEPVTLEATVAPRNVG